MATSSSSKEDTSDTRRNQRAQSHGSTSDTDDLHMPQGDGQATTRKESQALESSASYSSEDDFPLQKEQFASNSMVVSGSLTGDKQENIYPGNAVGTHSELEAHVLSSCQTCTEDDDYGFTEGCELFSSESGSLSNSPLMWEAEPIPVSSQASEADPNFILCPIPVPQDTLSSVDTTRNTPLGEEESALTEDFHCFVGIAEPKLPSNTAKSVLSHTAESLLSDVAESLLSDVAESLLPSKAESLLLNKAVHSLEIVGNSCEGVNEQGCLEGQRSIANTHLRVSLSACLKQLPFYQLLIKGIWGGGRKPIYWQQPFAVVLALLIMKIFLLWDTLAPVLCQRPFYNVSEVNMTSVFQSLTFFAGPHHGPVLYGYVNKDEYQNSQPINLMEIATPSLQEPITIALRGKIESHDQGITRCDFLLNKSNTGEVLFCNSCLFDVDQDHQIRCLLPLLSKKPNMQTFTTISGVAEGAKAEQGRPADTQLRGTAEPPPPQPVSTLESYFPRLSEPNLDVAADAQEGILVSEYQIKKEATHAFDRPKCTALPKDPFYQR